LLGSTGNANISTLIFCVFQKNGMETHRIGVAHLLARHSSTPIYELIALCANSRDSAAWDEFVSRYHRSIGLSVVRTARRWGVAPQHMVEDLVQETYLRLCADNCRLLLEFAAQHPESISGYIKTIAANLVHDYFKSRYSQKRGSGRPQESIEQIDPSAGSETLGGPGAIERQVLLQEIDRYLEACSAGPEQRRDRLIFWLYYRQGLSAKAIATLSTVGLSAKGVESVILRLTRLVRERIIVVRSDDRADPAQKGFPAAESY
jgi:RNA polymerase sigma-70 factor (ECF subfamily)